MKTPVPRNLTASVTARLRGRSCELGEDHQYLLMCYGVERLMYRLSQSVYAEAFVIKGAMMFLPESVIAEAIREDAAYQGVRVKLAARLGKIRLPLQVDIGFGGAITPKPQPAEFPPLLDFPAPRLAMHARETSIAEKFEAMVTLDLDNSRMKDIYDIWVLSREFEFEGATLGAAIRATFKRRRTELAAAAPVALTDEFATNPIER